MWAIRRPSISLAAAAADSSNRRARPLRPWSGPQPAQVIFTGSATEANALALTGLGAVHVLAGATEHLSVLEAAPAIRLPVDDHGLVDLATLERMLAGCDGPKIVSVMYVNNETGVIQPISEDAAVARRHGAWVHCDAVQAAGKIPLSMAESGRRHAERVGPQAGRAARGRGAGRARRVDP